MSGKMDHIELANVVKAEHLALREEVLRAVNRGHDPDEVWKKHADKKAENGGGDAYAKAMMTLAKSCWKGEESSRIRWIKDQFDIYFFQGKRDDLTVKVEAENREFNEEVIKVLDVGSCYDPFSRHFTDSKVKVIPIDINPGSEAVFSCDFTRVAISDKDVIRNGKMEAIKLEGYQCVIFCLLLDYLPTAKLRYEACLRAWRVLCDYGLLVIVEPDSSHQAKNQHQINSWRLGLAHLGFVRVTSEKLEHVRCLSFAKVPSDSQYLKRGLEMARSKVTTDYCSVQDLFYIPQDFNTKLQVPKEAAESSEGADVLIGEFTDFDPF